MTKDYYKILEISEFSTQEEIKTAYRRLARKWHPDIAGNTDDVISMFKSINEAYEILSDKSRKTDYDKARKFYNYARSNNTKNTNTESKTTNPNSKRENPEPEVNNKKRGFSFNWEEFLSRKHAQNELNKEKKNAPQKGADIHTNVEISVFEAINGTTKVINMLQTQLCPKCGGRKFINGQTCRHCNGKGEVSNYKKFSVKIPAGIKNNSKIRLSGEGEKGINGGASGDMYLTVIIIEPKNYKTEGLNILKTVHVTPYDAVLGCDIKLATLQGNVSLKIAPNTRNGQKIRLNGCGIESASGTGDMIVTVEIQIPEQISAEEAALYRRLKELNTNKSQ